MAASPSKRALTEIDAPQKAGAKFCESLFRWKEGPEMSGSIDEIDAGSLVESNRSSPRWSIFGGKQPLSEVGEREHVERMVGCHCLN